jgi:hypothetical protein
VQAHGPGAERNFPAEVTTSELPATLGEGRKQRKRSRYIGVQVFMARMDDPQTKRRHHVGNFACEEDAARAYDCAAVQARGPPLQLWALDASCDHSGSVEGWQKRCEVVREGH